MRQEEWRRCAARSRCLLSFVLLSLGFNSAWASHEIARDVGSRVIDFIDRALCFFRLSTWSGRPCSALRGEPRGPGCKDEQTHGTLPSFCGVDFGDHVFYCECCADHLMIDLPRRASLLMPGEETTTSAWIRNDKGEECRKGHVRTWSLGGFRLPVALCDRGQLECRCADGEWEELTRACGDGAPCVPPEPISEAHTTEETLLREGSRVRSVVDLRYGPDPDAAAAASATTGEEQSFCMQVASGASVIVPAGSTGEVLGTVPALSVRWIDFPQLGSAAVYRGQVVQIEDVFGPSEGSGSEGSGRAASGATSKGQAAIAAPTATGAAGATPAPRCLDTAGRLSIGQARCEDMDVHICPKLYSGAGGWHQCKELVGIKRCRPSVVASDIPRRQAEEWRRWALQWAWNPGLNWTTHRRGDLTVHPKHAKVEDIQEQLRLMEPGGGEDREGGRLGLGGAEEAKVS